jgi:ATP-dependent helicase HrpA
MVSMQEQRTEAIDIAAAEAVFARDRPVLQRLMLRIRERTGRGQPADRERKRFETLRAQSAARVEARLRSVPALNYAPELPVVRERVAIEAAIGANQVTILCGDTGSGKTTQVPKMLLGLGRGRQGMIGHTQPRRIAARSVAQRLSDELGTELGAAVGYQVRFSDRTTDRTLIKVMTDGILLAEIRDDPDLLRYDTIVIDEAHERSLNIDFLLGYLRGLLPRRPDLKLIITSATIEPARFSEFFGGAPVVTVEGRVYPVETRYRLPGADEEDAFDPGLAASVITAVSEIMTEPTDIAREDILVFLPGEREIRDCAEALNQAFGDRLEVLPLFSRLTWEQQKRVFDRHERQRVVLSTNVAETSLTVPGIRSVVDSGLARISRYSPRAKLQRLPVERISQASADQRRGRCGRVGPGLCVRLYAEEDYAQRPAHTPPEVQRTNLASVILQMAALGLGDCAEFAFLDPPETRLVSDGYLLLAELQAVDEARAITASGRLMSRLPVDPRIARMLVAAEHTASLREMLLLAAVMSLQDPRERPPDRQAAADERHAAWGDRRSDFTTLLNLWSAYQTQRAENSRSALRRWCANNFLSAARMREWDELLAQLQDIAKELGWRPNENPASYDNLHRALLCGLLSNIGRKVEDGSVRGEYQGARGLKFFIAPGTPLRKRAPRWIVCSQIVETSRVFARGVAMVEPQWIEWAGRHLLKRDYAEPSWDPRGGHVRARERVSLYGVILAADRRVDYGRIAPAAARELFVHEALVQGNSHLSAPFLVHNATLKAQLAAEESALRRYAVLVDDIAQSQFYLARIPPEANSLARFESWRWQAERASPQLLYMQERDLRRADAPPLDRTQFPIQWKAGANLLPLNYHFDPASPIDGATLSVPAALAETLDPGDLDWGIEGRRLEKIVTIIRGLPKAQRRHLVPAPAIAERALQALGTMRAMPFYEALGTALHRETGLQVSAGELAAVPLPPYLRLNLALIDADGRTLATSRDAGDLRRATRAAGEAPDQRHVSDSSPYEREDVRSWDFGELPREVQLTRQRFNLELYPALADRGQAAALVLLPDAQRAEASTRAGVLRLLMLALAPQVRTLSRETATDRDLMLLHHVVGPAKQLPIDIVERALLRVGLPTGTATPRTPQEFEAVCGRGAQGIEAALHQLRAHVREVLTRNLQVSRALGQLPSALDTRLIDDLRRAQIRLIHPGFVTATPEPWLDSLPRYLRALERRVAKFPGASGASARAQNEVAERWARYEELNALAASMDSVTPMPLRELRWLLEEYTVSLFAQELKTAVTVSAKRLDEAEAVAATAVNALR